MIPIITPANTINISKYFPFLLTLTPLVLFFQQTRAFIVKVFSILWKTKTMNYELGNAFYYALYKKSIVINFDNYHILYFECFSHKNKQYLPVIFKGHKFEIFLYKSFIPIFLFGSEEDGLKIEYLKFTFNFQKFMKDIINNIHIEKMKERMENEAINRFYITEIKGKSLKEKMLESTNGNTRANTLATEKNSESKTGFTISAQQSLNKDINKMIGFKTKEFSWYQPNINIKNKYQFTGEGLFLLDQVSKWIKSKQWCQERNIPHRRGALLYGPSGSGKSSLVLEIARKIGLPIYYFDISEMTNQEFDESLNKLTTDPAIILFEDFDNRFNQRESKSTSEQYQSLTFDYFINKLSGIKSIKSKFIFITTNHIDKIDSALLRPGRLDYKIELKSLNKEEKLKMAINTLDNNKELIDLAMKNSDGLSTAEFENHLIEIALDNYWK